MKTSAVKTSDLKQKPIGPGDQEMRQRREDLRDAMALHGAICKKLAEAIPLLTQAADMALELERDHLRKPAHRAVGLGIRLGARHLRAAALSLRQGLVGLASGSERLAARNSEDLVAAIEDPNLLSRSH